MFAAPSDRSVILTFFTFLFTRVRSDCECGYTVDSLLYTDLLESDFLHLPNITTDTDWEPQKYNISADIARGPFGKNATLQNVVSNPLKSKDKNVWTGESLLGGDAGLQLIVRGGVPSDGLIPMAEMTTERNDLYYGSFRAGMKLTGTNGTCGAFFWYFNDTQEIDMEFLSGEYNDTSHPVNLVLQSEQAVRSGFDAAKTGTFDVQQLPFSPADDFHEYRFDWSPDAVKFYADGVLLKTMNKSIPNSPGHITLSHWSNGDPRWSGGPPDEDAVITISYFKAYFNTSNSPRQQDWEKRCKNPAADKATCAVPEITDTNSTAKTHFFSQQKNEAPNQSVSGTESWAISLRHDTTSYLQTISTVALLFAFARLLDWSL